MPSKSQIILNLKDFVYSGSLWLVKPSVKNIHEASDPTTHVFQYNKWANCIFRVEEQVLDKLPYYDVMTHEAKAHFLRLVEIVLPS